MRHSIRRIVVNTALDLYRKKKREKENEAEYHLNAPAQEVDDIVAAISATDIINMVDKLPQKAAMVLKLYIIEGYAHKEIAEMLQINKGASKSQLNRARSLLKI